MATTLNINSLPDHINEHRDELFVESIVGAKSLKYVENMLGAKGAKEALNYLSSEVEVREASCGWNPGGSDTFAQRYVEIGTAEVEKEWCYLDFAKKYLNYQLQFEAGRESLPFEEKIAQSNVNATKKAVEEGIWQGISGVTAGWLAEAVADSAATVDFASGMTVSEKVNAVVAATSAKMLDKGVNIFMSITDYRNYVLESNSQCCANRPVLDAASEEITFAGDSRIKLIPVLGLEGTGKIVAATPDALVYATDIEGSETVYDLFFDKSEQKFKFRILWNMGTAIKFVDEVIVGSAE